MVKNKLTFSRAFVGRFLGRYMQFIVPWLVFVLAFEAIAMHNVPSPISLAVRAVYLFGARKYLMPQIPIWLKENGNQPGDKAVLRGIALTFLLCSGLCFVYAIEDYTGTNYVTQL